MKILAIRGENLASLQAFDLDLASGPIAEAGIFAITGPTGAGKSTLLDALCLALYDSTPRFSNSGGVMVGAEEVPEELRLRSSDPRSILRRGTAQGFAEVDFIGTDRDAYRARWEVRRARNSPRGKLQKVSMSLRNLRTHALISGKKTEVLAAIAQQVGLSYSQFRRSALLAQNDFAAFLHANKKDRSALLECMTGTEIYSRLGAAAYRRNVHDQEALQALQTVDGEERPLSAAEREALASEHKELQAKNQATRKSIEAAVVERNWFEERDRLARSMVEAKERESKLRVQILANSSSMELAHEVRRAREHRGLIDEAAHCRERAAKSAEQVAIASKAAESVKAEIEEREKLLREMVASHEEAAKKRLRELHARTEVAEKSRRDLQSWLVAHQETREQGSAREELLALSVEELREVELRAEEELAEKRRKVRELEEQRRQKTEDLGSLQELVAAQQEATSATKIDPLTEREAYLAFASELGASALAIHKAGAQLVADKASALSIVEKAEKSLQDLCVAKEEEETKKREEQLRLQEARKQKERLQTALDLRAHREALSKGEECPLCGSQEHPWASEEPKVDLGIRLQDERVAELEASLEELSAKLASIHGSIESERERERGARESIRRCEEREQGLTQELADLVDKLIEHKGAEKAQAREKLEDAERCAEWVKAVAEERRELSEKISALKAKLEELHAAEVRVAQCREELAAISEEVHSQQESVQASLRRSGDARASLYHMRSQELVRLDKEIAVCTERQKDARQLREPEEEKAEQEAKERLAQGREELAAAESACKSAQKAHRDSLAAIEVNDHALEELLLTLGCTWPELGERLAKSDEWLASVEEVGRKRKEELDTCTGELQAMQKREKELEEKRPKRELAEVEAELVRLRDAASVGTEREIHLASQLQIAKEADKRRAERGAKLQEMTQRAKVSKVIAELVGSADGQKFREYAQSLTLDWLVEGANLHLRDLAPRYLLQRVPGYHLELQIVDREMADEVRGVNSLSGGEGFLVSLALALGLSSLSAKNVQVETLLIDEGFGSLDADTLETALSVLDSLQASGRTVGLISHVQGIADRVGARVQVSPKGGGVSAVSIRGVGEGALLAG